MLCLRSHASERGDNVEKGWTLNLEVTLSNFNSVILLASTSENIFFWQIETEVFWEWYIVKDFGDGRANLGMRQRHKIREGTAEWKGKEVFKE